MSKLKCSIILDKLNRIKNTCYDQSFDQQGLPCILFKDNQIIANGQSRYMSIQFNHELNDCQLSFDNLHQIISKFNPDSEIDLIKDNDNVLIKQTGKGKRIKIKLPLTTDQQLTFFKSLPSISDMIPLPDNIIDAVKICEIALPKDTSRPEYNCFNIQTDKIVTTDGARLSIHSLSDELSDSFMLSIKDGLSISENIFTRYSLGNGYIDLMGEDIYSRISFVINDKFPDINIVKFKSDGTFTIKRDMFINELSRASLFSMGSHTSTSSIKFDVSKNGRYTIKSNNQMGNIFSKGRLKSDIGFETYINPLYLLQAIEQLKQKHVIINVCKLDNGYRFLIKETNFTYLFGSQII
jgi:hypothetical protein